MQTVISKNALPTKASISRVIVPGKMYNKA